MRPTLATKQERILYRIAEYTFSRICRVQEYVENKTQHPRNTYEER